jgi:deoxyribonuclease-4
MLLGAHESIAGGVSKAFERAQADTAECLQVFTKNARGWAAKPLEPEEISLFKAEARRTRLPAIAHCTYLVNLSAEDGELRRKSRAGFTDELSRCAQLGIPWLVLHPGAHADLAAGIALISEGLDQALASVPKEAGVLLEVTAGQGTSIGHQFEQIAQILDKTRRADRVGVCLDTCHLYAAGYDIRSAEGFSRTLAQLDRAVGLAKVKAIHLNDCKKPLGCRVDRHEEIGKGELGLAAFGHLLREPRFDAVMGSRDPGAREVQAELKKLRTLLGKPAKARKPR